MSVTIDREATGAALRGQVATIAPLGDKALMQLYVKYIQNLPQEVLDNFVSTIDPDAIARTVKSSLQIVKTVGSVTPEKAEAAVKTISKALGKTELGKSIANDVSKAANKCFGNKAARTLASKVPYMSLAIGLECARERAAKGEDVAAFFEVLSGSAACVIGPGTVVSTAIDVGLGLYDFAKMCFAGRGHMPIGPDPHEEITVDAEGKVHKKLIEFKDSTYVAERHPELLPIEGVTPPVQAPTIDVDKLRKLER